MENHETIIAIFDARGSADDAIKRLMSAGFTMNQLSVIGKGYHIEENVAGFYNARERMKFWGGLWSLFFGGLLLNVPFIGHVVVHSTPEQAVRARAILGTVKPSRLDAHVGAEPIGVSQITQMAV